MKFSFQLFFLVATTVVGTISVAAEPCLSNDGNWGQYDLNACNACATGGKGKGQCCDAIYRHSDGRDDDWLKEDVSDDCTLYSKDCDIGSAQCAPGLVCKKHYTYGGEDTWCDIGPTASLPPGTAAVSLLHGSSTSNDNGSGHAVVFVVVGLLGAAMMAVKVATSRHGVALRRNQYSEVYATTPIQV